MKYKGIIFDLDGVICHTDKYHYQAWKKLADKLGIYFDEEINNRLRGVSRMESFEIILEKYDGEMTEEEKVRYASEKNDLYRELLKNMTTADLDPQVKETLDALRSRGLLWQSVHPAGMRDLSWNVWDFPDILMRFPTATIFPAPNRTRRCS